MGSTRQKKLDRPLLLKFFCKLPISQVLDSLRVAVRPPNGAQVQISFKAQPTLKRINEHLRAHKLKKAETNQDNHFQALKHRLYEELKDKSASLYRRWTHIRNLFQLNQQ
jgi:hypothetical protein